MPTSLVTGAAGFIGSHVARHLEAAGHRVIALDDLSGGYADNVPAGVKLVRCSILNERRLALLFDHVEFDYVFHLAAYAAEGLSHFIRRYNYTNNVLGSVNLINEAIRHDVKRFVFTSSMAVYGTNQLPMHEDLTPAPEDPYGIAKHAVELDLRAAHEVFGLDYTIFRPHNVYGEGQNTGDKYRNVVAIFMNQVMQGKPMTVFGDGLQTRAFSYVDDVAPAIAAAAETPGTNGQTFNIGADRPVSMIELAHVVALYFNVDPDIVHLPPRIEVKHAYAAHDRLRSVFGDQPPTTLEIGVGRMAAWAKQVGPRRTPRFTEIELRRNLPTAWEESA